MPMGQNTTAFNSDELITSYIDNQIHDPELKKQVEEMISSDTKMNQKYKAELLTKQLLSSRVKYAELPNDTYIRVTASIDSLIQTKKQQYAPVYNESDYRKNYWIAFFTAPIRFRSVPVPRYAFAVVIMFVLAGSYFVFGSKESRVKNPYVLAGTEKSIMIQALNSFHSILSGDVKMQYASSNAAEIDKYVNDNANFHAYIPKIENYVLKGCILNEYHGRKLAHLVYVSGNDMIYIYQTTMEAITKQDLDLPQGVRDEILKAKYYMCDEVDDNNCTMTLWIKDNIVCASMTTMPKQKMQSTFTSFIK
jgi:hypothetical protein